MNRNLTNDQIATACRELLLAQRDVTIPDVQAKLLRDHNAKGKNNRVGPILQSLKATVPFGTVEPEVQTLRDQLRIANERAEAAEKRATRAEELADHYQDFWARRYAEKLEQLQKSRIEDTRIPFERYFAVYLRADRLAQQLSRYESVEPLTHTPQVTSDLYLRIHQRAADLARRLSAYEPIEFPTDTPHTPPPVKS